MSSIYPVKWVRINRFSELTGDTEKAIRRKIEDGVWIEGKHYKRCKDGRIRINVEAYDEWVDAA